MADNESKVSVDAEITVDSSKAASGLKQAGKAIADNTRQLKEYNDELDKSIKKHDELGKAVEKSAKKQSASQPLGLLVKSERVRRKDRRSKSSKKASVKAGKRPVRSSSVGRQVEKVSSAVDDASQDAVDDLKSIGSATEKIGEHIEELKRQAEQTEEQSGRASKKSGIGSSASQGDAGSGSRRVRDSHPEYWAERTRAEHFRGNYWGAKAGRIDQDHRYKPGWRGGLASGVGGMISRARNSGGLSGFAARVGTGVGMKHPEMNIMKGATTTGLGLNPLALTGAAAGAAIARLTEAVGNLAVESLQAYGEVDKLKTSLSVVYGSDAEANAAFEEIKEYSLESPFGVEQTTEMAILLKQSGVYGTELLDTMRMIGDTAGGNADKFQRIANNYAQIASIGKASMLDMRQFAYAGIPIYKKVAEELGVSQSVLRQMISDGEVTNEVIEKVFKTMTSEGGEFYKAVERGAQTLNARLVNLQDSLNLAKASIGEGLFKADVPVLGNRIDGQGALGGVLNALEELVRKADDWARLKNIERDIAGISGRREAVEGIDTMIAEMMAQGKDVSALRGLRADISGVATPDSELAIQHEAYKFATQKLELGSTENRKRLEGEIKQLEDALKSTSDKNVTKTITGRISQLRDEMREARKYAALVQSDFMVSEPGKGPGWNYTYQPGKEFGRFSEMAASNAPAMYQVEASNLATMLLEQGQKRAASASSLGAWADGTVQEYKGTDAGKAEAERKRKEEYDRNYAEFTRLNALIDDTGRLLDGVDVDIGEFVDLMKSGIITPLEEVSLAFHDIARHKDDTSQEIMAKRKQWIGLRERAGDVGGLIPTLPPELSDGLKHVVSVLEKAGFNSEANVNELNHALVGLSKMQGFAQNDAARLITQYLLTSTASVTREARTYDDIYGKGDAVDSTPLWKRITGSALGVDAGFISDSASKFFETYKEFEGRNISKGVVSGMVASGRSAKDITGRLRFKEGQSIHGGQLIDWEATRVSMEEFAMSAHASTAELSAYSDSLSEQIGMYKKLKETMFTTGEDWEKLKAIEDAGLASQLHNAFSGINESMLAFNAAGESREVEVNEDGMFVFKDTQELLSAQREFEYSLEEVVTALDANTSALNAKKDDAAGKTYFSSINDKHARDSMQSAVKLASADTYRDTRQDSPESIQRILSGYIDSMIGDADVVQAIKDDDLDAKTRSFESSLARFTGMVGSTATSPDEILSYLQEARREREGYADRGVSTSDNDRMGVLDSLIMDAEMLIQSAFNKAVVQSLPDMSIGDDGTRLARQNAGLNSMRQWSSAFYASDPMGSVSAQRMADTLDAQADNSMGAANVLQSVAEQLESIRAINADVKNENQMRRQWNNAVSVNKHTKGTLTHESQMQKRHSDLLATDFSNASKSLKDVIEKEMTDSSEFDPNTIVTPISEAMRLAVQELRMANPGMTQDDAIDTVVKQREIKDEQVNQWDFRARAENAIQRYAENPTPGNTAAMAGGVFAQAGMDLVEGSNVGDFIQGTAQGGPLVGLLNTLARAMAGVVESIEWLDYTLNPVTNVVRGLSDVFKVLLTPLLVISRLFDLLGQGIQKVLSMIPGWDDMIDEIDEMGNTWAGLNNEQQKELELLRQLNEQLGNTRRAFIEAEEYYLTEKRHQNATWAIEAQGLYGGGAVTNVNDMILTPHGNFSTAPDDYILAMKDPTSLMGAGGSGGGYVQVKLVVNNNASDLVDTSAEEQTGDDGTGELIVTISRVVAGDYASGKNGWDSAIAGRRAREQGRRVTR